MGGVVKNQPETRINPSGLAERVGFEPTDTLPHRLISSQVHSTTLPPLRGLQKPSDLQLQAQLLLQPSKLLSAVLGRSWRCSVCAALFFGSSTIHRSAIRPHFTAGATSRFKNGFAFCIRAAF